MLGILAPKAILKLISTMSHLLSSYPIIDLIISAKQFKTSELQKGEAVWLSLSELLQSNSGTKNFDQSVNAVSVMSYAGQGKSSKQA